LLLADPRPEGAAWALPAARDQAIRSAAALHGTALVGAAASRSALLDALDARWLQVATRTSWTIDGAAFLLHDGEVAAREIAARGSAPEVVVLASCDTAVGEDDAGNGSLANAFLDAGADTVVATRWLIEDAEASAAVDAYYQHGATHDPIGALRAMQLAPPANVPPRAWAAFEVFSARPDRAPTAP
jgi:CHAT domain-containing protein